MSSELLLNVTAYETRVAVIENEILRELYLERAATRGIFGNIYVGQVARVVPGMQAAFIDLGIDRAGFLHVKDLKETSEANEIPHISDVLHPGEKIVVQVIKEPVGTKGARLSGQITLAARNLVYLPGQPSVNVSQRIEDQLEKQRLRNLLEEIVNAQGTDGGVIARTSAQGASEEALAGELALLTETWRKSLDTKSSSRTPTCIYEDLPLYLRVLRDLAGDDVECIQIDSREAFESAVSFVDDMVPELKNKLELYRGEHPLFELYSVENEIECAMHRQVSLKCGGNLIIDPTEAMTVIDVNSGANTGKHNLEDTAFATNLEAASTVARQLRLRNIAGIVVIDFIDMVNDAHKQKVMQVLAREMMGDKIKTFITEMSPLGLVELTRKRTRDSLSHLTSEGCPVCNGRGTVKSAQTVCYQIFREIEREFRHYPANEYTIKASNDVIDCLLDDEAMALGDLQKKIDRPVQLRVDADCQREHYEIVLS